jgi:aminopeptidase N
MLQQLYGKQAQAGYGILGHAAGVFNLGYFYPVLAAREGGSWVVAEPAGMGDMAHFEVANFLVKVIAPQNMVVVSSGIRVGDNPQGSGESAARETVLLGTGLRNFALQLSTRYEIQQKTVDGVRVRFVHVDEHGQAAQEILDQAASALAAFQKLFGPYPWPELDVVEAPLTGGAGGVEYPGLVTIAMGLSAGPTGNPSADLIGMLLQQTQTTEYVLAHEVAHQWWHGLVGSDSNAHPFLDEALANYSAVLYFEARHGQEQAGDQLQLQLVLPYQLMRMFGGPDGPVDRPTRAFSNQLEYSAIVYGKGALFYHALRRQIGQKRFLACLKSYARRQAFTQTNPDGLVKHLASCSGRDAQVRRLYARWIQERHADEDIGLLDPNAAMAQLMGQMQSLQGLGNMQVQGLDAATLKLFQDAVNQLGGGP